jgi:hypothetical protein
MADLWLLVGWMFYVAVGTAGEIEIESGHFPKWNEIK